MRIDIPIYCNDAARKDDKTIHLKCVNSNIYTGSIFVACCPRSGSLYMTKVLTELGYDVGHEKQARDGTVGYNLVSARPKNCFHQVRHPLKQIASMRTLAKWDMTTTVMTRNPEDLTHRMAFWVTWNKICEEFCVWRYRIEQLPEVWGEFCERIGHESCEIPPVPTNTNSRKHDDLTWDDLFGENRELAQEIVGVAKRYGYDTPGMDKVECQNLRELETAEVASV